MSIPPTSALILLRLCSAPPLTCGLLRLFILTVKSDSPLDVFALARCWRPLAVPCPATGVTGLVRIESTPLGVGKFIRQVPRPGSVNTTSMSCAPFWAMESTVMGRIRLLLHLRVPLGLLLVPMI